MKLSKVTRVIELFNIDNIEDYRVDKLDPNRVPNSHESRNGTTKKCKVTLLQADGSVDPLPIGETTSQYVGDDFVLAVHVEYHHLDSNDETIKYEKMLLIK